MVGKWAMPFWAGTTSLDHLSKGGSLTFFTKLWKLASVECPRTVPISWAQARLFLPFWECLAGRLAVQPPAGPWGGGDPNPLLALEWGFNFGALVPISKGGEHPLGVGVGWDNE
jgi:hypothetical protein